MGLPHGDATAAKKYGALGSPSNVDSRNTGLVSFPAVCVSTYGLSRGTHATTTRVSKATNLLSAPCSRGPIYSPLSFFSPPFWRVGFRWCRWPHCGVTASFDLLRPSTGATDVIFLYGPTAQDWVRPAASLRLHWLVMAPHGYATTLEEPRMLHSAFPCSSVSVGLCRVWA